MKPFYVTNPTGDKGPMARLLQRPTPGDQGNPLKKG